MERFVSSDAEEESDAGFGMGMMGLKPLQLASLFRCSILNFILLKSVLNFG
jgi:hypothetical protein